MKLCYIKLESGATPQLWLNCPTHGQWTLKDDDHDDMYFINHVLERVNMETMLISSNVTSLCINISYGLRLESEILDRQIPT